VFIYFCREVSKKGSLYADVLDDIQKLQEKYVSSEVPIVTGNSTMDHNSTKRGCQGFTKIHEYKRKYQQCV